MELSKIEAKLVRIEALLLEQKEVLTLDEVSQYTGISKSYLYKLTSTGGIPCYKPNGKLVYIAKDELNNWLLQNRKATTEELESQASTYNTLKKGGVK